MKLGVLKTGQPPKALQPRFGGYPDMFRDLLGKDAYAWRDFDISGGELPDSVEACDAYIVTGSSCGVYDPEPWIEPMFGFLRAAKGRVKLVGVCFGHQALAQAFGGQVIKSPKGWGVGAHDYEVLRPQPWMDGADRIRLPASHQDQVVELPPGADVIAANAFTPMGALAWRSERAISIQLHPEFEPDYAKALIEARRGSRYSDEEADAAVASYSGPDDRARVGTWIRTFLDTW